MRSNFLSFAKVKTTITSLANVSEGMRLNFLIPFKNREIQRLLSGQDGNNVQRELNEMEQKKKEAAERLAAALGRENELASKITTLRGQKIKK